MLLRVIIKNLFSFKDETEFNLIPGKASRLKYHKYERSGLEILKLSAIYGANGSGKSNLVKAIMVLKTIVLSGAIPVALDKLKFKLSPGAQAEPVELGIEFFVNDHFYYYSIAIKDNKIVDEYFCETGQGKRPDVLIFHRTIKENKTVVQFFEGFEEQPDNVVLGRIITKDLLKDQNPLFSLLVSINNNAFSDVRLAFSWFVNGLHILFPQTEVQNIAQGLDSNPKFRDFATELMCSFHTGISSLKIDRKSLEEFLGTDSQKQLEKITADLKSSPGQSVTVMTDPDSGEKISVVNEDGKIVAKRLLFEHLNENNEKVEFSYREESDGTRRLLEYIPALNELIYRGVTFVIDEIERSVHPLITKELIAKFSKDESTQGQLIFTTHESNLLDQEIFRTDEIWFADKGITGATKLYSLSDFKEHNTIDIRKGYLNGRYGGIPFLGNLEDLNWNKYRDAE
jgi:AAA15 family ATPase/GTPase